MASFPFGLATTSISELDRNSTADVKTLEHPREKNTCDSASTNATRRTGKSGQR